MTGDICESARRWFPFSDGSCRVKFTACGRCPEISRLSQASLDAVEEVLSLVE
jgi:hypothetical protein